MDKVFITEDVANKIGVPIKEWPGNCFYIASLCVQKGVVKGKARYGHFTGIVHKKSMFFKTWNSLGFSQHGWVELDNGEIFDPTRWVFECVEPYIFIGDKDDYDLGGSGVRSAMRANKKPPAFNPDEKVFDLQLPKEIILILKMICQDERPETTFSVGQLFWIANEKYTYFGEHAKTIYKEFERIDNDSMIPLDYWMIVMED